MARGHMGGFGKAFSDAFAAMLRINEDERWHRALEEHYARVDWNSGADARNAEAARKAAEASAGNWGTSSGGGATGNWWTPERMKYATDRLQKEAGLTQAGAAGLVARWAGVEAAGGPTSSNNIGGGHWGIGQWGKARGGLDMAKASFEDQVTHAIGELNGPEKAAGDVLRNAKSPEEGARGASMYERAEGYNASTGKDNFTDKTPVARVLTAISGKTTPTETATTETATTETATTTPTKGPNKGKPEPAPAETTEPKPTEARGGDQTAAVTTPYQVAGEAGLVTEKGAKRAAADLEAHRAPADTRTPEQMDQDSPAPPPGPNMPRNERALPTPEQAPPSPLNRTPISAIPPGPSVSAQDARFDVPPEAGYPPEAITSPLPPQATINPQTDTSMEVPPARRLGADAIVRAGMNAPPYTPPQYGPPDQRPIQYGPPQQPKSIATTNLSEAETPYEPPASVTGQATHMPPQQNVRGQVAVGTPTDADKPTRTSQPVSSSTPPATQPVTQPGNSRFVTVARPNADVVGRQSVPYTTALDLSHLWGPNPPVSQRASAPAPTPAPVASRPRDDSTQFAVGSPNMDDASLGQDIMGSAKGGPITQRVRRYVQGGAIPANPTMGFAVGGSAFAYPAGGSTTPTVDPRTATTNAVNTLLYGNARGGNNPGMTEQDYLNKINSLTPDQQTWLTQQQHLLNNYPTGNPMDPNVASMRALYNSQFNPTAPTTLAATPAATPAAPAIPAAPTPVAPTAQTITTPIVDTTTTDPTTTTVTGAPKLPDNVKAKSYDPNVDQRTGAGFTNTSNIGGTDYSVGADDLLKQNDKGEISGNNTILSRKGGPIPRLTQRVKYDDGGGVGPSAAGMPPGLGGPQAIPPIYYNSATYAGAGAPVGKGISQTSAPTTIAGAIPSLPMARGGVVGYDDGGSVDPDTGMPVDDVGGYGAQSGNARAAAPAPQAPPSQVEPPPQADPYATATGPQDIHPNLPAWTPQVKDANGNPSRGVIGAIAGGLHYLASQLGLSASGQNGAIANDPNTQTNRQSFSRGEGVPGAPMPDHEEMQQLHSGVDPGGQLNAGLRTLAGMEAVRNYYLIRGEPAKADQMAASMMQYSVSLSKQHGDEAVRRYYNGDLHGAVNELNHASDAIGDGTNFKARVSPDGKSVEVSNTDLNGNEVWSKKDVSPQAILGAAIHARDGSLAWSMYEAQAAKYDPATAQMIRDRNQQRTWEHQQAMANQREDAKTAAAEKKQHDIEAAEDAAAAKFGAGTPLLHYPAGNQPATAPTTPALPGPPTRTAANAPTAPTSPEAGAAPTPDSAAGPQQAAPPSGAPPSAQAIPGLTPPAISASPLLQVERGERRTPALPPGPTQVAQSDQNAANLAAPDAQDVSLDQQEQAGYARIHQSNFSPEGYRLGDDGQPIVPPDRSQVRTRQDLAAYNIAFKEYQDESKRAADREAQQRADLTADINSRRQAQTERFKVGQTEAAEANREKFEQQKETDARTWDMSKPRDPKDVERTFSTAPNESGVATGKEPAAYMATALGLVKPDGTPDIQALNGKLDRNQQAIIATALQNGYTFSPHANAETVADLVTGLVTNPNYMGHPTPISPDKTYGVPRVSITVDRGNGTTGTMVLPEEDLRNLKAIAKAYGAAQPKPAAPGVPTTPAVSPTKNFPAPTAPVTMTPRGPVTPYTGGSPFVPSGTPGYIPRGGASGGTGFSGPRRGFGAIPPPPTP